MKRGWPILMLWLVVASIVALWSRSSASESGGVELDGRTSFPNNVAPVVPEPTLSRPPGAGTAARVMSACPAAMPGRGGPLAGVTARCIGDPAAVDLGAVQDALSAPPVLPLSYIATPDGTIERLTDPAMFETTQQIRTAVKDFTS